MSRENTFLSVAELAYAMRSLIPRKPMQLAVKYRLSGGGKGTLATNTVSVLNHSTREYALPNERKASTRAKFMSTVSPET